MPGTKVLVVDDNKDNANIIRQYLTAIWGYPVSVAYNGDDAVKMFDEERPNIVLLDVMMPGRDGWDVCKSIKARLLPDEKVRVIMVTALDDISNKQQAIQAGADDFVEKPFDLSRLAATVQRNISAIA